MRVFFCLCLGLFSLHALAAPNSLKPKNEKTLQWLMYDLPPILELKGNALEVDLKQVEGPVSKLLLILQASLPEYEHRFVRVPFMRSESVLKEKQQFCTILMQESTARNQFMNFGEDIAIAPPLGLVTREATSLEKLAKVGDKVDLKETLATDKKFRLGVIKGRFYSEQITPLTTKYKNTYSLVADGTVRGLLNMLSNDRLDGVLAFYLEMVDYQKQNPLGPPLHFTTVKEAPEYLELRAACEKSPWGEKALKTISHVIREKKLKDISHQYLLSVLPESNRKEYQKLYDARPQRPPSKF